MSATIDSIRRFNRAWTEVLGLLDRRLLDTEHNLSEARVIFELAQRESWERLELRNRLGMDQSFLTKVLSRLQRDRVVSTSPSPSDGRAMNVSLTASGRAAYKILNERSAKQIRELIAPLSDGQQASLVEHMTIITQLVRPQTQSRAVTFRGLAPGDLGWVVGRHGAIYADEFGWNIEFEALVADIVGRYQTELKPGRESAWIAEVDGARAGCVFCCERDSNTAQLRILLVEPWARGLRLGSQLVERCIQFAEGAGYSAVVLWTNDVLVAARTIYIAAGFELIDEEAHHSFGVDLTGQTWRLSLPRLPSPGS